MPIERGSAARAQAIGRVLIYGSLLGMAAFYLMPLWVMVTTSLKSLDEIYGGSFIGLPRAVTLEAWAKAWSEACVGTACTGLKPYFVNSLMMVVPAVALSTTIGALNGYVLTKWRFRGANLVFGLILFGCFLPFQAVILPMAQVLGMLGLSGSIPGLVLVHTVYGICFTTLFFRNYFVTIPDELTKAAQIDGAGPWRTFFSVYAPLATPGLAIVGILAFNYHWNEFFRPLIMTISEENFTLPLGLVSLQGNMGTGSVATVLAGVVISMIPALVVFIFGQRTLREGLTAGSHR